jgi:hypothetical protein
MITSCIDAGELDRALVYVEIAERERFHAHFHNDHFDNQYFVLITASDLANRPDLADAFLSKLISSSPQTTRAFEHLVNKFQSSFPRCETIYTTLSPHIQLDCRIYRSLIRSCIISDRIDRAYEYVDIMNEARVCAIDEMRIGYEKSKADYGKYPAIAGADLRILRNDYLRGGKYKTDLPITRDFNRVMSGGINVPGHVDKVLAVMEEIGVGFDDVTRNILLSLGYFNYLLFLDASPTTIQT